MTAPVDVLAELDRRIEIGELFGQEHDLPNLPGNAALREARAAVAELISAAEYVDETVGEEYPMRPMLIRLRAALARCGGGK